MRLILSHEVTYLLHCYFLLYFRKIRFIKLTTLHVRTLSDIGVCTRLKICILHSNFIRDFKALSNCSHLTKLDLHNNQVSFFFYLSDMFSSLHMLHSNSNFTAFHKCLQLFEGQLRPTLSRLRVFVGMVLSLDIM